MKYFFLRQSGRCERNFPIFPEVWGILYLATKHYACLLRPNIAGSNYITMSHQLLVEVRVTGGGKFPFLSGNRHGKCREKANLVMFFLFDAIKSTN